MRGQVVQLLLGRGDVNPNKSDGHDQIPLAWAAGNRHEGVVQLLLGRGDINPKRLDNMDWTPLMFAAQSGHEGLVRLLLGRGISTPTGQTFGTGHHCS